MRKDSSSLAALETWGRMAGPLMVPSYLGQAGTKGDMVFTDSLLSQGSGQHLSRCHSGGWRNLPPASSLRVASLCLPLPPILQPLWTELSGVQLPSSFACWLQLGFNHREAPAGDEEGGGRLGGVSGILASSVPMPPPPGVPLSPGFHNRPGLVAASTLTRLWKLQHFSFTPSTLPTPC